VLSHDSYATTTTTTTTTIKVVTTIPEHKAAINSIAFSSDSKILVATGNDDKTLVC
jgi:WD40 repeat protein